MTTYHGKVKNTERFENNQLSDQDLAKPFLDEYNILQRTVQDIDI